jgi:hypothetical protein
MSIRDADANYKNKWSVWSFYTTSKLLSHWELFGSVLLLDLEIEENDSKLKLELHSRSKLS